MLPGYLKHAEIILPGESVLCIEYETHYLVVLCPSEFVCQIIVQNCMLPPLIPFFTTVSCYYFREQLFGTSILKWNHAFFWSESHFAQCVNSYYTLNHMFQRVVIAIVSAISVAKLHFGTWGRAYFLITVSKIFQ